MIGFDRLPGQFAHPGAARLGADAVQPVVAAEKITARIAHDGEIEFLQRGQDIAAQAVRVGVRGSRLVDAAIDAAAHVFGKAAKEQRRKIGNFTFVVDQDPCR